MYRLYIQQMNEVERTFHQHKKRLIQHLGNGALNSDQINKIGKFEFGDKWVGCYGQDKAKIEPGYQIVNTGSSSGGGIHWVGLVITTKTAYIYDSFARAPGLILRSLVKRIERHGGLRIKITDKRHEQRGTSSVCGHISLAFLLTVRDLGIKQTIKFI